MWRQRLFSIVLSYTSAHSPVYSRWPVRSWSLPCTLVVSRWRRGQSLLYLKPEWAHQTQDLFLYNCLKMYGVLRHRGRTLLPSPCYYQWSYIQHLCYYRVECIQTLINLFMAVDVAARTKPSISAPLKFLVCLASRSTSKSLASLWFSFILAVCMFRIWPRPCSLGKPATIIWWH